MHPEESLYAVGDVVITPTIARIGGTSYPIANIASVGGKEVLRGSPLAVLIALSAIPAFSYGWWILGVALLTAGVVWQMARPLKEYRLILTTSSGELTALSTKKLEVFKQVKSAIEKAVSLRR